MFDFPSVKTQDFFDTLDTTPSASVPFEVATKVNDYLKKRLPASVEGIGCVKKNFLGFATPQEVALHSFNPDFLANFVIFINKNGESDPHNVRAIVRMFEGGYSQGFYKFLTQEFGMTDEKYNRFLLSIPSVQREVEKYLSL